MQAQNDSSNSSLLITLRSVVERLNLNELFPSQQPLEVELGSGDGSFIVQYAQRHPERNFIGVERLLGRLRKIDRKGRRSGLTNLRALRVEASYFLEYLLPAHAAAAIHIYFPDPWPKRKHRKYRLVNERFSQLAKKALVSRGRVYLRTDDADYFEQMQRVFSESPEFEQAETPEELAEVVTDFERDFNTRGIETLRAAYALRV
jgi:tRNA (guanine-N7-)-methyltransferase